MSTSPTPINLNDTTPASPNGEVLVKWQGDNSSPRNVSAYVPFSSPTQAGAMFNVSDLGGTGQDPTVVGITGIEIDQTITPTEDYQAVRFVADGVSDSGIAFGHLKFGHLTGGVDARTTASETITKSSHASCVTFADVSPAANIAVALDSTANAHFWCFAQNQTASHNVVFTPSSGTINDGTGATSTATLASGSNCALFFNGTNWTILKLSGGGGAGTVTSVALTMPAEFSVSGSPITTSGTLAVTKATQSANQVFAGPTTGSAAAPTFRALVAADIPNIAESQVTNLTTDLAAKVTNPMTTKGDIIYGDTSGTPARLAAGTSGLVLTSNGSGNAPSYQAVGSVALPPWITALPDYPPASAGSLDDEFTDTNFNDNGKWTLFDHTTGGNATRSQSGSWFTMRHASNGGGEGIHAITQPTPSTPWTVTTKLSIISLGISSNHWSTGMCLRDSGTGKYQLFKVADTGLVVDNYSNINTYASTQFGPLGASPPAISYHKLYNDGTNLHWSISFDGVNYYEITSFSKTAYLANPNQVGLFINPYQQFIYLNSDFFRST